MVSTGIAKVPELSMSNVQGFFHEIAPRLDSLPIIPKRPGQRCHGTSILLSVEVVDLAGRAGNVVTLLK
jgi:hypothetical protein